MFNSSSFYFWKSSEYILIKEEGFWCELYSTKIVCDVQFFLQNKLVNIYLKYELWLFSICDVWHTWDMVTAPSPSGLRFRQTAMGIHFILVALMCAGPTVFGRGEYRCTP